MTLPVTWWELSHDAWTRSHSFPCTWMPSCRGHSRQTNKQTKIILTHECHFWTKCLSFFLSLNEKSIGQHLWAKLMWCRATKKHSNPIKLLPVSGTAQALWCPGAFACVFLCAWTESALPALLVFTWLTRPYPSGLPSSENCPVTPLTPPKLSLCSCYRLRHTSYGTVSALCTVLLLCSLCFSAEDSVTSVRTLSCSLLYLCAQCCT